MSNRQPKTKLLQPRRMLSLRFKTKHLHPRGMLFQATYGTSTLETPISSRAAVGLTTAFSMLALLTAAVILLTIGG